MRGTLISDRTYNQDSSWWREIILADGDTQLRHTIRYNAYRFQSWARVEVWTELGWEQVHRIPGAVLAGWDRVSYTSKTVDEAVFEDDLFELDRVASLVLGLD